MTVPVIPRFDSRAGAAPPAATRPRRLHVAGEALPDAETNREMLEARARETAANPAARIYEGDHDSGRGFGIASDQPLGKAVFTTTYDTTMSWLFDVERVDLRALYEKSKDMQWNASSYLDWSTEVDPERDMGADYTIPIYGTKLWDKLDKKRDLPRLRREMAGWTLSNFMHGEQGALLATAQLVTAVPSPDAKLYASTQVMDEARHVEAYDRYLREKIGLVYPCSPYLKELLEEILKISAWDMKYLGMQIMVEGLALAAFGYIHETSPEPLIKEITKMIMRDEARHVAFGVLSLRDLYGDMTQTELREREDFILYSARLMRDRFMGDEVWRRMDFPLQETLAVVNESPTMKLFRELLFSKIVPNVKRIGLLTPRVRAGFQELNVLHFENCDASALCSPREPPRAGRPPRTHPLAERSACSARTQRSRDEEASARRR